MGRALPRYVISAAGAALITVGLFTVMEKLISREGMGAGVSARVASIHFVRLKLDETPLTKRRNKPEKPQLEAAPPLPLAKLVSRERPSADLRMIAPTIDLGIDLAAPELGTGPGDTDVVPIVRIAAMYPRHAEDRRIEGWVEIEFTIAAGGDVKDAHVTAYHPSTIFNRSALRAIKKWKYQPRRVAGVAVDRPGVQVRITFELPQ